MQEHHSATFVKIKQHPSDPVLSQVRTYLVNTTAYGAAYRHTHRPAKLDGLDVLADSLAVLAGREAFQPFPNRLSAGLSPVKDGPDAFTLKVGLGSFFAWDWLRISSYNLLYHIRYTSVSSLRQPGLRRNEYSHPPGISIRIAPESVSTCPGTHCAVAWSSELLPRHRRKYLYVRSARHARATRISWSSLRSSPLRRHISFTLNRTT
jgi:hypothetical protein